MSNPIYSRQQAELGSALYGETEQARLRDPRDGFVGDPIANEIRTGEQAEPVTFPTHEIKHRRAVEFLQFRQIENRPQITGGRRLYELIQIGKMTLK